MYKLIQIIGLYSFTKDYKQRQTTKCTKNILLKLLHICTYQGTVASIMMYVWNLHRIRHKEQNDSMYVLEKIINVLLILIVDKPNMSD